MEGLYPWLVFAHLVGAFGFALAHGVSAAVALRLTREREIERVRALLELSQMATGGMYVALTLLLIGGVSAAFVAGLWGRGWIWAATATLVFVVFFMYARASRYYGELRGAVGMVNYQRRDAPLAVDADEMARLLASPRGYELAGVGGLGLLVIVWLMYFKPF